MSLLSSSSNFHPNYHFRRRNYWSFAYQHKSYHHPRCQHNPFCVLSWSYLMPTLLVNKLYQKMLQINWWIFLHLYYHGGTGLPLFSSWCIIDCCFLSDWRMVAIHRAILNNIGPLHSRQKMDKSFRDVLWDERERSKFVARSSRFFRHQESKQQLHPWY
jgi:hypothetical protein